MDHWQTVLKFSFGLGCAALTIAAPLRAAGIFHSFLVNPSSIAAYIFLSVALVSLVCSILEISFPFRAWPGRAASNGEVLDDKSSRKLVAMSKKLTTAQAREKLAHYRGKQIRVQGRVGNVSDWDGLHCEVVFRSFSRSKVLMIFENENTFNECLSKLEPRTPLAVIGTIDQIDSSGIRIVKCLVDSILRIIVLIFSGRVDGSG